jgi:aryl-alcohol dehydrogenase-like predicted oxidoreductase
MQNKVGLGTFPLASPFNKISSEGAVKVVESFLDLAGYYIDTAPMYGAGKVEELLGKVLKGRNRDSFYLSTKTVKHVGNDGQVFKSGKYDDVIKGMDDSLSRLQLDYVDQLMVHSPDPETPISETLSAMEELMKQGKVKELAVSNVNLEELKEYNKTGNIKYVQNRYSLITRSISDELESYLSENDIYLVPWHLLEVGLLTDKARDGFDLREEDMRNDFGYWNQENQDVISRWVVEELAPIADELEITIAQLCIAWALADRKIDYIVVGTTNPKNLRKNLRADEIDLSADTIQKLDNSYRKLEKHIQEKYSQSIKEFRGLNDKFY